MVRVVERSQPDRAVQAGCRPVVDCSGRRYWWTRPRRCGCGAALHSRCLGSRRAATTRSIGACHRRTPTKPSGWRSTGRSSGSATAVGDGRGLHRRSHGSLCGRRAARNASSPLLTTASPPFVMARESSNEAGCGIGRCTPNSHLRTVLTNGARPCQHYRSSTTATGAGRQARSDG